MVRVRSIRILVIDNHEIVRRALAICIEVFEDLELVGEAENGEQGLALCASRHPDVVLIERFLPGQDTLTVIYHMTQTYPAIKVIVMCASDIQADFDAALKAGASGYIVKNLSIDELANAIRAIVG